MKRVAVYARVSTDHEDQKNSVENQELYFKEYIAKEDGWQLYKMYADEGISGTSLKHREQFHKMMADANANKFDIILTKEVCRFARNTLDTIEKTRELKAMGIEVRFLIDNISTFDTDGELRLTIMAGLAQDESRRTSERVQFGIIQQMKKGVAFGNNMYGYQFKNGKLKIIEKEAEMVRKIFHWYLDDGLGAYKISKKLNEEKYAIKKPKNEKNKYNWEAGTIKGILQNVKYVGDLKQRITYTTNYLEHTKKYNEGEVPFIYIKNHHTPIIDRDTFEKVQVEIARRRKLYKTDKINYSNIHDLSGKLFCGKCGKSFISCIGKVRKDGSRRKCWKCKNKVYHGKEHYINQIKVGCNSVRVSDVSIKDSIKKSLVLIRKDKENILKKLEENINEYFKQLLDVDYNIDEEENKKNKYLEQKEKLVELFLNGNISKDLFDKKDKEIEKELNITDEIKRKEDVKNQILKDREIITNETIRIFNDIISYRKVNADVYRKIINKIIIYDKNNIDIHFKGFSNLFYFNNQDSILYGNH